MPVGEAIQVTFELVTPAYAGGAEREKCDGLRPPTLKGLLRFWWRALHPELQGRQLFEREAALFGSTDPSVGQRLRVVPGSPWQAPAHDPAGTPEENQTHGYMAYGAVVREEGMSQPQTTVARIHARQKATFGLHLPRTGAEQAHNELIRTLWVLSAFGGIGSRSRRGWGSLRLECDFGNLPDPHNGDSRQDTVALLKKGLEAAAGSALQWSQEPDHTAFSAKATVLIGPVSRDCGVEQALRPARNALLLYRRSLGTGQRGARRGPDGQVRARWLSTGLGGQETAPFGSSFGLPHNANYLRLNPRRVVQVGAGEDLKGRRASPVFFKLLRVGSVLAPVILYLPSRFIPDDIGIYAQVDSGSPARLNYRGDVAIRHFLGTASAFDVTQAGLSGVAWCGLLNMGWERIW